MKKAILLGFLFLVLTSLSSFDSLRDSRSERNDYYSTTSPSVSASVQWAKTYGGTNDEYMAPNFAIQETSDGGSIFAGATASYGDIALDFWILKLTSLGDIEWQRVYGGVGEEIPYGGIQETSDGGYIVAGFNMSGAYPSHDFWILKLTHQGDIEWQRAYHGDKMDWSRAIQITRDGGYIVTGQTDSFGAGKLDILVLKLSSIGDIEWQRAYGGSEDDWAFHSVQQTSDGGYITGGSTESYGAGGLDFWVVKLTSIGDIEWQRSYGGSENEYANTIRQTSEGGYIVGGRTKTFAVGEWDCWILKLDPDGGIEWQRTYGGSGHMDNCQAIYQTPDGGYVFTGGTNSFGAGGKRDIWILSLDSTGDIIWEKTYGGRGGDFGYAIRRTVDGGSLFAGLTSSYGAGGSTDRTDFLILKLSPNGDVPSCGLIGNSSASVSDTSVTPLDTHAVPISTNVIPTNTDVLPKESNAIVYNLCPATHTLTLSAVTGGTTDPEPGIYTYDGATYVIIEAKPDNDYTFSEWSGDASGSTNPRTITMDSDKSITANFTKETDDGGGGGDGGDSGNGGGCLIATAAYGSLLHPYVRILRDFRDRYLMPSKVGRVLINFYYKYSPSVADLIVKHKVLKVAVRINLLPLIALSYSMLRFGSIITAVILVFIFGLQIFSITFFRKKLSHLEAKSR